VHTLRQNLEGHAPMANPQLKKGMAHSTAT